MSLFLNHKLKAVLLITIAVRLLFLVLLGKTIFFYEQTGLIHGSSAYDEYALNLLETGVYGRDAGVPDAKIAPIYSYVVAAIYGTIGRGGLQIGIIHILLDCLTIALVYDVSRSLFKQGTLFGQVIGEWVGAGAGLFTAFYPYLVFQNLTLIDTPIFMTLMSLFLWLMVMLREQEHYTRKTLLIAIIAGLVLGITTLLRALLPVFAILTAVWFLMRLKFWDTVLRLLPVAIVSILVLIPWMSRSYTIYGNFVAVALNSGENIWQGNNPMTIPLFEAGYDAQWSQPPENAVRGDAFRNNAILAEAGINYLQQNPEQIPALIWTKFLVYWSVEITPRKNPTYPLILDEEGNLIPDIENDRDLQDEETFIQYESGLFDRVARPVHIIYFTPLLLLAIIGIALSIKQWRDISLLWFLQISMTLMYVIFHPATRYRVPTDPFLFIFSAYTLVVILQWWLSRKQLSTGDST